MREKKIHVLNFSNNAWRKISTLFQESLNLPFKRILSGYVRLWIKSSISLLLHKNWCISHAISFSNFKHLLKIVTNIRQFLKLRSWEVLPGHLIRQSSNFRSHTVSAFPCLWSWTARPKIKCKISTEQTFDWENVLWCCDFYLVFHLSIYSGNICFSSLKN